MPVLLLLGQAAFSCIFVSSRKQLTLLGLLLLHLLNFRSQFGYRKDPFLTGERIEGALTMKNQYHIASDHK